MASIKKILQLSDWLTYELETDLLEPPVLRVKVKPVLNQMVLDLAMSRTVDRETRWSRAMTQVLVDTVLEAIQEWDLTDEGKPMPLTDENKRTYLTALLGAKVKDEGAPLGMILGNYIATPENFLKK